MSNDVVNDGREEIAIVGMAGHFPGARNIEEFWENLRDGVESIRSFTIDELKSSGIDDEMIKNPSFVNAGAVMDDADCFDAAFFGIGVREAELMDPQHRVFLETSWEALESAGYDSETYDGLIGVFGGVAPNTYFQHNLMSNPDLLEMVGHYNTRIASALQYAITRVSYKLDLKGPSLSVNTACSTSGVAIHLASQSLLSGECDMALAGGARIKVPLNEGYLYVDGGIQSPDGHCRAFDANAHGTVVGSGAAVIVLKRLSDAVQDGDTIHATIKGTAINNDGAQKIGFTAPSKQGQATVIAEAQAMADVEPDSISYVEAHGTGTSLGDPIEVAALTQAFREGTDEKAFCAIGSVKTNIGHLDAGAGTAGIIKTALAMQHKQIPPSLNYEQPNPQIDFDNSPFYVNDKLSEWRTTKGMPRRAGVSSFGLGGTNAHIILEEAPGPIPTSDSRIYQLLLLSAKSDSALSSAAMNLGNYLDKHDDIALADAAYTLQIGRRRFGHRRVVVCKDRKEAVRLLQDPEAEQVSDRADESSKRDVVFMFTGQGAQYVNMGRGLYDNEQVFSEKVDDCSRLLEPHLGLDLRTILYPEKAQTDKATEHLTRTSITQPALFVIEYALASLWRSWGVEPVAMIGHSIGEYVAACLSGVFTLENALELVATRGRLMQSLPSGAMLAVSLTAEEVSRKTGKDITVATINAANQSVVSGTHEAIKALEEQLADHGIPCKELRTSHAFHSPMMDPILDSFSKAVKKAKPQPPDIPFISNVTGVEITKAEATDPKYWAMHLRQTVRFADGLGTLLESSDRVFLEIGPGKTLSTFAMQHPDISAEQVIVSSMRHPKDRMDDEAFVLASLGKLWMAGANINWKEFYSEEQRRRVPLPTYPFERKRYWFEPADSNQSSSAVTKRYAYKSQEVETTDNISAASGDNAKDRLLPDIRDIMCKLVGMSVDNIDDNKTFLSQGFDSLLITQANTAFQKQFKVKLPLRMLFESASTPEKLSKYLGRNIPDVVLKENEASKQESHGSEGKSNSSHTETISVTTQSTINSIQTVLNLELNADTRKELEDVLRNQREILSSLDGAAINQADNHEAGVNGTSESYDEIVPLVKAARNDHLPLSFSQQRLWYLDQLEPNQCVYNFPSALRMIGNLDVEILTRCINEIIDRHETLRTRFGSEDGKPDLIIDPSYPVDIPTIDLEKIPYDQREHNLEKLLVSESRKTFDLKNGPLIHLLLIRFSDQENILSFTSHHIISDGWSLGVFRRELSTLYDAYKNNKTSALPILDIQYADFATWQRNKLKGDVLDHQLRYWKSVLDGDLPVLNFTADRPRPNVQTYNGATEKISLTAELVRSMESIGKTENATLFIVLLTAFKVLLHKYTGQSDIIIGSPIANRTLSEIENLIGFFANTLVFRTQFEEDMTYRELLTKVRDGCFGAYQYQDMPFEKLVEELHPARDLSRTPIFQAMFGYQDISNRVKQMADIKLEPVRIDNATARTDLTLFLSREADEITGVIEYNTDLFDADTMQRFVENFKTLLNSIASNPDGEIDSLPIISESEMHRVLVDWNNTYVDLPEACIHELFEAQVEKSADAVALIDGNTRLSYRELNQQANRVAHRLQSMGIGPDVLVGICMERSSRMIVALLGILKAGGAYVPLDPGYPRDRVAFMLSDCLAHVVITETHIRPQLPDDLSLLDLDAEWDVILNENHHNPINITKPDNLAYVIYTSGSTGKPKGVAIEHRSTSTLLQWAASVYSDKELKGVAASTSICFDLSVFEIFLPLSMGGKVILAENALSIPELPAISEITLINTVPSAIAELVESQCVPSSVITVNLAGEPLTVDLVRKIYDIGTVECVYDLYGPSEDTTYSTYALRKGDKPYTVGRPIANTQIYILDRHMQPVPQGVPGELHIGGTGLARGYLNRPDLTAEKFVANPFNDDPDARLYKTGDLARYMPDGQIEYLGRIDHQIKLRGYRIELGEIESVLKVHEEISDVVVIVREDVPGNKRLVAYLVPVNKLPSVTELRNYIKQSLPDYMVPAAFVELKVLPQTPNGKIDRKALPEPEHERPDLDDKYEAPDTPMEKMIAGIWQDLLEIDHISVFDNFFDLGGYSLLSLRVVSRLEKETGVKVNPGELVLQTLGQLAAACEARQPDDHHSTSSGIIGRLFKPIKNVFSNSTSE